MNHAENKEILLKVISLDMIKDFLKKLPNS